MVAEAQDEPGALPLVENALHWLWQQRTRQPPERPAAQRSGRPRRHSQPGRRWPAREPRQAAWAGPGAAVPLGQGRSRRAPPHPPADAAPRGLSSRRRRRGRAGAGRSPRRHARAGRPEGSRTAAADHRHRGSRGPHDGPAPQGLGQPDPRDPDPQQRVGRRGPAAALLADALALHRAAPGSGSPARAPAAAGAGVEGPQGSCAALRARRLGGLSRLSPSRRPGEPRGALSPLEPGRRARAGNGSGRDLGSGVEGLYWAGSRELPIEMAVERWAYLLVRKLPLPSPVEISAEPFMMGSDRSCRATHPPSHLRRPLPSRPDRGDVRRVGCVRRRRRLSKLSAAPIRDGGGGRAR